MQTALLFQQFYWASGKQNNQSTGFLLLLSLYGSSLYHNWIVRDREMRDETRSVEEEKKSRQSQQEKRESLHDRRGRRSVQIGKRRKFQQNRKKKKVIEAQSTSFSLES